MFISLVLYSETEKGEVVIEYPEIKLEFRGWPVEVTRNEDCSWPCWTCVVKCIGFRFELETQHSHLSKGDGYWSTGCSMPGFLNTHQAHDAETPQAAVDALIRHLTKVHGNLTVILGS